MPKLPIKPAPAIKFAVPPKAAGRINSIVGRFRMRTAQASDASDEIARWMIDPAVVMGLNMAGQAMSVEQLRSWIAGFDNVRKNLVLICNVSDNRPVGFLMFDIEPRHLIGSFHLFIGAAKFRRGEAGFAAFKFVLKHLFDMRGVAKVSMEPLSRNRTVVQACQWLGLRCEGILKAHRLDLKTGERLDQHVFAMTREEYRDWSYR